MVRLLISVTDNQDKIIRKIAYEHRISIADAIRQMIDFYVGEKKIKSN